MYTGRVVQGCSRAEYTRRDYPGLYHPPCLGNLALYHPPCLGNLARSWLPAPGYPGPVLTTRSWLPGPGPTSLVWATRARSYLPSLGNPGSITRKSGDSGHSWAQ